MDSYMASNGLCFHGHLDYFQNPPLGGRFNAKPGDHGTPKVHNRWFILFYHVWGPAWIEFFEIAFGWGPGHTWLRTTFGWGPVPHYMILEVSWESRLLGRVWSGPKTWACVCTLQLWTFISNRWWLREAITSTSTWANMFGTLTGTFNPTNYWDTPRAWVLLVVVVAHNGPKAVLLHLTRIYLTTLYTTLPAV